MEQEYLKNRVPGKELKRPETVKVSLEIQFINKHEFEHLKVAQKFPNEKSF